MLSEKIFPDQFDQLMWFFAAFAVDKCDLIDSYHTDNISNFGDFLIEYKQLYK
jgi:hypothetical protein